MSQKLTGAQVSDFQQIFDYLDKDGDGTITINEFLKSLHSLGLNSHKSEVLEMIQDHDVDNDGSLDFPEFVSLITRWMNDSDAEEKRYKTFRKFDTNGDGFI